MHKTKKNKPNEMYIVTSDVVDKSEALEAIVTLEVAKSVAEEAIDEGEKDVKICKIVIKPILSVTRKGVQFKEIK